MVCPKCGKEINENTKFCDGCGEEIIQPPVVPKKKSKKKLFAIIVAVVVVLISIIAMTSGETIDNPNVIKSEVGSEAFGDVSFDITFDEFIELYNDCVYEDEEYDSVRQMRYLHKEDFEKQVNYEAQLIMYEKKFGTTYENLGALSIFVNSQNDKIQSMEWRCKAAESDYATEQAIINYHYTLPASFFSLSCSFFIALAPAGLKLAPPPPSGFPELALAKKAASNAPMVASPATPIPIAIPGPAIGIPEATDIIALIPLPANSITVEAIFVRCSHAHFTPSLAFAPIILSVDIAPVVEISIPAFVPSVAVVVASLKASLLVTPNFS